MLSLHGHQLFWGILSDMQSDNINTVGETELKDIFAGLLEDAKND